MTLGHMININYGNPHGQGRGTCMVTLVYLLNNNNGLNTTLNGLELCRIVSDYTIMLYLSSNRRQHIIAKGSVWRDKDQQWQTIGVCRFVCTQSSIAFLWY